MTSKTGAIAARALLIAALTSGAGSAAGQGSAPPQGARWTEADARFMTGMIAHHAQAVLMASWAPTHGASRAMQALCERIVVGQQDEIALMQRWLGEWGKPVPEADARHHMMPGMEHTLMPGMLTAEQLTALDQARGPAFDRMFLSAMIRHHEGALAMIQELVSTPGAARDDNVFKFVSDMNADQTIEIERMNGMLAALPSPATTP